MAEECQWLMLNMVGANQPRNTSSGDDRCRRYTEDGYHLAVNHPCSGYRSAFHGSIDDFLRSHPGGSHKLIVVCLADMRENGADMLVSNADYLNFPTTSERSQSVSSSRVNGE